jgi:LysM repeat protein
MRKGTNLLLLGVVLQLSMAQSSGRMTRLEYFERYAGMAVNEMHRSGIPASITLAQGALESGDGNSSLALQANNHFGIKCHNDWTGKKTYQDDDAKNECFRKYASVEDSYRDHSDYLRTKQRYAFLFELEITDYKGWARGLKKAGYATSPTYADALIRIIEEFDLQRYEKMKADDAVTQRAVRHHKPEAGHEILENNRVKFIRAMAGDTYESLTRSLGKTDRELPAYNDARKSDSLAVGAVVYIQPKRNKAAAGKNTHTVKEGETLHTISQTYALKLESLRLLNQIAPGTEPETGTVLQLRKAVPAKSQAREPQAREKISGGEEEDEIKVDLNLD